MRINTPPLRHRREDIPLLLNHYLAEAARELGTPAKSIDTDAMDVLQASAGRATSASSSTQRAD